MGNITNLATTGKYTTEFDGIKVSCDFTVDNETKALKTIKSGLVTEDETTVATFGMNDLSPIRRASSGALNCTLSKGREVELISYISETIAGLEFKIAQGEAKAAAISEQ